jgi:hypothetical protein
MLCHVHCHDASFGVVTLSRHENRNGLEKCFKIHKRELVKEWKGESPKQL